MDLRNFYVSVNGDLLTLCAVVINEYTLVFILYIYVELKLNYEKYFMHLFKIYLEMWVMGLRNFDFIVNGDMLTQNILFIKRGGKRRKNHSTTEFHLMIDIDVFNNYIILIYD